MYLHLDKDQLKDLALTVVDLTVHAYILSDREYIPSSSKTIHLALNPEARGFYCAIMSTRPDPTSVKVCENSSEFM